MTEIGRIGIVGAAGWLGTAIERASVAGGIVPLDRLTCSFRTARPADALDCTWTRDNRALAEGSDIVILSVRPDDWQSVEIDARGKLRECLAFRQAFPARIRRDADRLPPCARAQRNGVNERPEWQQSRCQHQVIRKTPLLWLADSACSNSQAQNVCVCGFRGERLRT